MVSSCSGVSDSDHQASQVVLSTRHAGRRMSLEFGLGWFGSVVSMRLTLCARMDTPKCSSLTLSSTSSAALIAGTRSAGGSRRRLAATRRPSSARSGPRSASRGSRRTPSSWSSLIGWSESFVAPFAGLQVNTDGGGRRVSPVHLMLLLCLVFVEDKTFLNPCSCVRFADLECTVCGPGSTVAGPDSDQVRTVTDLTPPFADLTQTRSAPFAVTDTSSPSPKWVTGIVVGWW